MKRRSREEERKKDERCELGSVQFASSLIRLTECSKVHWPAQWGSSQRIDWYPMFLKERRKLKEMKRKGKEGKEGRKEGDLTERLDKLMIQK